MTHSMERRKFLQTAGLLTTGAVLSGPWNRLRAENPTVTLPFENGLRELVAYPQKRPLILLTARPPQLETPFGVFNEGLITPNDAFFVRYHLSDLPTRIDLATYRLHVRGAVRKPLELSLDELRQMEGAREITAVNQCSGNSRGFFEPRVNGGQLGHGAMGNARWRGIPLKHVLERAGVSAGARQVSFNGLDRGLLDTTPDFIKALDIDHALDGEVMLAYAMNGEDIPMLNGFPLRLVVPGYYGTYWVKHLSEIEVLESAYTGFWMSSAYRVAVTPGHALSPGQVPAKTEPISRFTIRSFITSITEGSRIPAGREVAVRGIAFDSGQGIKEVAFSADGGRSWQEARLGKDLGRYSFREWKIDFTPRMAGRTELLSRASNRLGETQPMTPLWNPAGYLRNVVERVRVDIV